VTAGVARIGAGGFLRAAAADDSRGPAGGPLGERSACFHNEMPPFNHTPDDDFLCPQSPLVWAKEELTALMPGNPTLVETRASSNFDPRQQVVSPELRPRPIRPGLEGGGDEVFPALQAAKSWRGEQTLWYLLIPLYGLDGTRERQSSTAALRQATSRG
jgi:hypothetical protein